MKLSVRRRWQGEQTLLMATAGFHSKTQGETALPQVNVAVKGTLTLWPYSSRDGGSATTAKDTQHLIPRQNQTWTIDFES